MAFDVWSLHNAHYKPWCDQRCFCCGHVLHRMGGTDQEGLPTHMFLRLPGYLLWLFKEILMSDLSTAKVILTNQSDPEMFRTKFSQKTGAGVATYANSITLTPGTVTIDIEKDAFLVHALSSSFGDDVRSLEMNEKVLNLESVSTKHEASS